MFRPPDKLVKLHKETRAIGLLADAGGVIVALSGGVDSAVLLHLARKALGRDRVLAATGRSSSLAETDLADARRVAREVGVRHLVVDTREAERPEYRKNNGDRCFYCRWELFDVLRRIARERSIPRVAYGAIVDDLGDHRPGMAAAERQGVLAPLLAAGMTKADVREIAGAAGLAVRSKPAAACLASRIPTGTPVTPERLRRIERAEAAIRPWVGARRFRVRDHGAVARLEFDAETIGRVTDPTFRKAVTAAVREAGFRFVTVDLGGYRPGGRAGEASPEPRIGPKRPGGQ